MPTYAFTCLSCDRDFDKNVSYEDIQSVVCEECGNFVKRVYSFTGLVWSPTRNSGYS